MSNTEYGWRPLATAPRDGTYILLAGPSWYVGAPLRAEVCKYDAEFRPKQPWINHAGDSFTDGGGAPTLWMPLPSDTTGEKEFPGQLLGGRSKCEQCGEIVGNVAYHREHDCPKKTDVKELVCSRCGNGIDDLRHIRYSPDMGKPDKHYFNPVKKSGGSFTHPEGCECHDCMAGGGEHHCPEELPCPILETIKIEGHTSIEDLLRKLSAHALACAYGCPNRRAKRVIPVWIEPPACPRCGKQLTATENTYGEWKCDNHENDGKCLWFNYELIQIIQARFEKLRERVKELEARLNEDDHSESSFDWMGH